MTTMTTPTATRKTRPGPHRWVPPARALHLIDLANLCGLDPRHVCPADTRRAALHYLLRADLGPSDHLIVGVNPSLVIAASQALPHARIVVGGGPVGADNALIKVAGAPAAMAERYHRLVVGSGDHAFTDLAAEARGLGVHVTTVSLFGSLARSLGLAAHVNRTIPRPPVSLDSAAAVHDRSAA